MFSFIKKGSHRPRRLLLAFAIFVATPIFASVPQNVVDSFTIYYELADYVINPELNQNSTQLQNLSNLLDSISKSSHYKLQQIEIYAYSSPEGVHSSNLKLADKRAKVLSEHQFRLSAISAEQVKIRETDIAWRNLDSMLTDSQVPYAAEVQQVIEDVPVFTWGVDADNKKCVTGSRNQALMQLRGGVPYLYMMTHLFPLLRTGNIIIHYTLQKPEPPVTDSVPSIIPTDSLLAPQDSVLAQSGVDVPQAPVLIENAGDTVPSDEPIEPQVEPQSQQQEVKPKKIREPRQLFALKTNLLYDLGTALNAELEIPIGNNVSITAECLFPWWETKNNYHALQLLAVNFEARYWFNPIQEQKLTNWFVGLYGGSGLYDVRYNIKGTQGEYKKLGLSGGYAHTINKTGSLRLEYSLGLGYMQSHYRKYDGLILDDNLLWKETGVLRWIGPTQAKVSLVWMIKTKGNQ